MSKGKKALEVRIHKKAIKVTVAEDCKPMLIPVFVSGLLTIGIKDALEAGHDPFDVLSSCKEAVRKALASNSIALMVEVGDENEKDNSD